MKLRIKLRSYMHRLLYRFITMSVMGSNLNEMATTSIINTKSHLIKQGTGGLTLKNLKCTIQFQPNNVKCGLSIQSHLLNINA